MSDVLQDAAITDMKRAVAYRVALSLHRPAPLPLQDGIEHSELFIRPMARSRSPGKSISPQKVYVCFSSARMLRHNPERLAKSSSANVFLPTGSCGTSTSAI